MSTKKCNRCNHELSLESFRLRKNGVFYKQCIKCNQNSSANKKKNITKKLSICEYNLETHKKCVKCFKVLQLSDFNKSKNGLTKSCTVCLQKFKKESKIRTEREVEVGKRICVRCNVSKNVDEFKSEKTCIDCCDKYAKLQKIKKVSALLVDVGTLEKICYICMKTKDIAEFSQRKSGSYNKGCISCCARRMKSLKDNKCKHGYLNKSACRDCGGNSICAHGKYRTYCQECDGGALCLHKTRKDRCSICRNGTHFCEHNTLRTFCILCLGGSICEHKIRRTRCIECNFSGFLKDRVSSRINKALKKNKMSSSIEYLGCDIDTFRTHLETKFLEGMDWKNYGSVWHIDHIIPVAYKKPTTEEVIKRLHYTNTQPLWALDNISKGNRYIG